MLKIPKIAITYLIPIIIFGTYQFFYSKLSMKNEIYENIMQQENTTETQLSKIEKDNQIWKIEIPKINLDAETSEGTDRETLNEYVGHFEETQVEEGNIGLAAHNRGYAVNYFQNLKNLREGDEIIYQHNDFQKIYEVEKCRIIKDTDWKCLENTEENRLTLITCMENEPEYRRCIQAIEIKN